MFWKQDNRWYMQKGIYRFSSPTLWGMIKLYFLFEKDKSFRHYVMTLEQNIQQQNVSKTVTSINHIQ